MLLIIFYPETPLVSKHQIMQAIKLHSLFREGDPATAENYTHFLDVKSRIYDYITILPPELLTEFKKGNNI